MQRTFPRDQRYVNRVAFGSRYGRVPHDIQASITFINVDSQVADPVERRDFDRRIPDLPTIGSSVRVSWEQRLRGGY